MRDAGLFNVKYKNQHYDIYTFLNNHPGGTNYLTPYKEKDVTKRMKDSQHSKAAFYLLEEYKQEGRRKNSELEDLERLVDWDKPMLSQVVNLGTKYKEWVNSPVDRQLRLFSHPILERLTITPWYIVPMVWIPVTMFLIRVGAERYSHLIKDSSPCKAIVLHVFLGLVLWSLLEYALHRWVFHVEPSGNSKVMIFLHFAIHGLHHKVPFDTRRLVFPPLPAAVIALTLYKLFSFVIPESSNILLTSGSLLGYVIYDMVHFYLHYGAPNENSYFYQLKRHHSQHHFAHQDSGFGISSVFWDKIFGTAIHLKHLSKSIKW